LALLPALHLLLLVATRVRPTPAVVAIAAVQTFILMFMVFCRTQTYWEIFAIVLAAAVVTALRPIRQALFHPSRWPAATGDTARKTWPAVLAVSGVIALLGYSQFAPNESLYAKESKSHIFWHDLFVSTVSADPKLLSIYGYGYSTYTDDMATVAAIHDLRGRNDGASPVAEEVNGVLGIDMFKSNGAYDQEMRRVYLRVVREHPWLVLRSFLVGKPLDQLTYFSATPELWTRHNYLNPIILALAATLLALALGAPSPTIRTLRSGAAIGVVVLACSTMTSFFYPTALIAEVLVTWLMLFMLGALYLPLALLFNILRHKEPVAIIA
jgi:hypothetical protein